jgi:hypothetical protein
MIPVFASAPLLPALLTCAAAWAIAVWALKQRDSLTRLLESVTGSRETPGAAETPDAIPFKKSKGED